MADLPLLLDAQDLVESDAGDRGKGGALAGRIDSEAGVVGRKIDLPEEGVGRFDRADPGEPQFLRQPVLRRLERPLGSPSGLRRIGPDVLDPELGQRPSHLGGEPAVDLAGLGK